MDIRKVIHESMKRSCPFIFVIGGRGTGKTYGALKYVIEDKIKFMYLRRLQTQTENIKVPELSPMKPLNRDMGWSIHPKSITRSHSGYYECEEENGKLIPTSELLGYLGGLSTFSNLRGFDASDVKIMILDEFIPEKNEAAIKSEGDAWLNSYETVNRDRELFDEPPLIFLNLANANDLGNPIFIALNLVMVVDRMEKTNQSIRFDEKRGIAIFRLQDSIISVRKQKSALYRLSEGTSFSGMAIANSFAYEERLNIKSRNLKEYRPVLKVGELAIYTHKSNGSLYCTSHIQGGFKHCFESNSYGLQAFRKNCRWLQDDLINDRIEFETYLCQILLTNYFK